MGLIIPLLYLLLATFMLKTIIDSSFVKALPFTFIISAVVLFISQMIFKTFYVGIVICILFALSFIVYLIVKKKSIKEYFTNDVFAFIFVYLLIFILDFNRSFYKWDEFSHWGKMVKEMFRLDSFYSDPLSRLIVHKDYPPIMSILEYFHAFLSGGYSEAYLIRSLHLFSSSLILSTLNFDKLKKSKVIFKTSIVLLISVLLITLFDISFTFNTIYIDIPLSLLVAFILYNVYKEENYNLTSIILLIISLIFLMLFKQVSLAFYLLISFFIILMIPKKKENIKYLLLLILPAMFYVLWSLYTKNLGIVGQFNISDIKLNNLLSLTSTQKEITELYIKALFTSNLLNSFINITYIQFIIIIPVLGFILINNKREKAKRNKLLITLLLGMFGYMALMLVLYLFSFDPIEGLALASFDRYMNTYSLIIVFVFLYIKGNDLFESKNKSIPYIIVIVLLLIITPISYLNIRPHYAILNNSEYQVFEDASSYIDSYVDDELVYIVDTSEESGSRYFINYYAKNFMTNDINTSFITNINVDEINNNYFDLLSKYDYLYIFDADEDFINTYSKISNTRLNKNKLYKIEVEDNKFTLKEVHA